MDTTRDSEILRSASEDLDTSIDIYPEAVDRLAVERESMAERTALAEDIFRPEEDAVIADLEREIDDATHTHDHPTDEPTSSPVLSPTATKETFKDKFIEVVEKFKLTLTQISEKFSEALSSLFGASGRKKEAQSRRTDNEPRRIEFDSSEYEAYPAINEMPYSLRTRTVEFQGEEPSGTVYIPAFNRMFVVSDNGKVLCLDSNYSLEKEWDIGGDLEGITYDPRTNLIYVIAEGSQELKQLRYEDGELSPTGQDWDLSSLIPYNNDGSGVEALAFVNGQFYVGDQHDGTIHIIEIERGNIREVGVIEPPEGIDRDISGLHYDENSGMVYAVWDRYNRLALIDASTNTYSYQFELPSDLHDIEGVTINQDGQIAFSNDSGSMEVPV